MMMPTKKEDLSGYPGFRGEEPGYPSLMITSCQMTIGPLAERNTGLPVRPFVHSTSPGGAEAANPARVKKTVRLHMWNSNYIRLALSHDEFHNLTKGPEEPDHDVLRGDWYWPKLDDQVEGEEGEGKRIFRLNSTIPLSHNLQNCERSKRAFVLR